MSTAMDSEIYIEQVNTLTIEVKKGEVSAIDSAISQGTAVRVIKDGRLGFSYSTKPGTSEKDLITIAGNIAKDVNPDMDLQFPAPEAFNVQKFKSLNKKSSVQNLNVKHSNLKPISQEEKIQLAKKIEAAAMSYDKRIKGVRKAAYEEDTVTIQIKNSNGMNVKFSKVISAASITAIAEDKGESEWASEIDFAFTPSKLLVEETGRRAAERAIAYLGGKKISSRKCPCVIDREVASNILEATVSSFFADAVYKNKSKFGIKDIGSKIYTDCVTLIDDARLPNGFSSVPYDSEGRPTQKNILVKNGILSGFLSDTFWAKKLGISPSASSVRPALMQMPKIGIQNLYIEPGTLSQNKLLSEMGTGFYITDLLGLHTANQITGDFSVGASGFWIENGQKKHSVKGVTIAGNFHNLLKNIVKIGSDIKFGRISGSPSLQISEIAISG